MKESLLHFARGNKGQELVWVSGEGVIEWVIITLCKREDLHLAPQHPWKVRCGSMHSGNPIAGISVIAVSLRQDGV